MNELEQQILSRFKKSVLEQYNSAQFILFGSRARGDYSKDSDMDILIILDNPVDDTAEEFISHCAWEAGYEQGIVVSPVIFTRYEWEESPERYSLLSIAVREEGIAV